MCCTTFETQLSAQVATLKQGHIGDQKSCHPLAFTVWRVRVVPQSRKVFRERHNGGARLVAQACTIALSLLLIAFLGFSERAQRLVPLGLERSTISASGSVLMARRKRT